MLSVTTIYKGWLLDHQVALSYLIHHSLSFLKQEEAAWKLRT